MVALQIKWAEEKIKSKVYAIASTADMYGKDRAWNIKVLCAIGI